MFGFQNTFPIVLVLSIEFLFYINNVFKSYKFLVILTLNVWHFKTALIPSLIPTLKCLTLFFHLLLSYF